MTGAYRLYGAETSAYSTKMRSYLRYKGVAFDWRPRTQDTEEELAQLSRFPTLPVLVTASGFAVHDTTPMMEALEADSPDPSATPSDPALVFLSSVLEEYADTWLAKVVYHYRWTRKKDQRLAAQRSIEDYFTRTPPPDRKAAEDAAIVRMLDQLRVMQLDGELGGVLEKSFKRLVKLLDDHLRKHLYLFGGQPTIADFAIAGQLIQALKDPTPAKIIEKEGEFVLKWCEFMAAYPKPGGPFEPLDQLRDTLAPLFASELAAGFLPWAAENLETSLAGGETFTVRFGKDEVTMAPIRSAARSFRELRKRFLTAQTIETLRALTDETGCTLFLQRPQAVRAEVPAPLGGALDEAPTADAVEAEAEERPEGRRRRSRKKEAGAVEMPEASDADALDPMPQESSPDQASQDSADAAWRMSEDAAASETISGEGSSGDLRDESDGDPGEDAGDALRARSVDPAAPED